MEFSVENSASVVRPDAEGPSLKVLFSRVFKLYIYKLRGNGEEERNKNLTQSGTLSIIVPLDETFELP